MATYKVNIHAVIPSETDGPIKFISGTVDASVILEVQNLSILSKYFQDFLDDFKERGLEEHRTELYELNNNGDVELVGLRVVKPDSEG